MPRSACPFASIRSLEGWESLDGIARRYSTRPASLCDVDDPYVAFCVDEAAAIAGAALERRIWDEARAAAADEKPASGKKRPRHTGPAVLEATSRGLSIRGKIPVLKKQPDGSYR